MQIAAPAIEVVPMAGPLGAEISGVSLGDDLADETFEAILAAWREHLVLLFRRQDLSDARLVAFSRRLGDLDLCPPNDLGRPHIEEAPEIVVVSNVLENGRRIGSLGNYEALWHTDMSYLDAPPKASLLYALEVPVAGGDTSFANMYRALERMPSDLRAEIEGAMVIHDATYDSAGNVRRGFGEVEDMRNAPGTRHPMVRIHPETGRAALFLGRRRNASVVGRSLEESERLLDRVWSHATRNEFTWTHQWRGGDLLLWDNRCTMHRRDGFAAEHRRVMHRTQVKGERVTAPDGWGA